MEVRKFLNDISNPQVFNPKTCPQFINQVTAYLYDLQADHFTPKTPQEIEALRTHGGDVLDTIFPNSCQFARKTKTVLIHEMSCLTSACKKIRDGLQYARFSEEYLMDWLYRNNVYEFKFSPIYLLEAEHFDEPEICKFRIEKWGYFISAR